MTHPQSWKHGVYFQWHQFNGSNFTLVRTKKNKMQTILHTKVSAQLTKAIWGLSSCWSMLYLHDWSLRGWTLKASLFFSLEPLPLSFQFQLENFPHEKILFFVCLFYGSSKIWTLNSELQQWCHIMASEYTYEHRHMQTS